MAALADLASHRASQGCLSEEAKSRHHRTKSAHRGTSRLGTPGPSIMLPEGLKDLEGPRPAGDRRSPWFSGHRTTKQHRRPSLRPFQYKPRDTHVRDKFLAQEAGPLNHLLKDPGVLLKDPGVLLKDPGVL